MCLPGTPAYTPPEFYMCGRYGAVPTTVWQLGLVLYQMLFDRLPFTNLVDIICSQHYVSTGVSPDCQDFLSKCLNKFPESCPTLEQLKLHPWLPRSPALKRATATEQDHGSSQSPAVWG
ncbi:serine/threonine-protein kinase pim-2-like [Myripristis murdjan]|uniref:serine/threonine-protein kinase pim-2-like n=1 Tax=Myripristis murdjan TaxID=586833 RepID=UPI001175E7BD|nr:serine/threonine-protein kinase pim-2-like [Myripristis murdjan]